MKVFKIYFLIDLCFIVGHLALYIVTVMGLGSGNSDAPRSEIVPILVFMSVLGASPNLLLLLAGLIRKSQVKEHALWTAVFTFLVFLRYLVVFWLFAIEYHF